MNKEEQLKELFAEWSKDSLFKPKGERGQFVPDGIVDETVYNKQKVKILFLLKDPHDEDGLYSERGICDEILTSTNSGRTWLPIASWTRALLSKNVSFADSNAIKKEMSEVNEIDGSRKYFKQIAVMNLKKASGESNAISSEINSFAKDKENIIKEIRIIEPDIIIACGVYDVFGENCINQFESRKIENKIQLNNKMEAYGHYIEIGAELGLNKKIILVEYCHPANRGRGACSAEEHFYNMKKIQEKII